MCHQGPSSVCTELQSLLEASGASMGGGGTTGDGHAALDLGSKEGRVGWWKRRVELDQRMEALLDMMQGRMLGPWRCAPADLTDDTSSGPPWWLFSGPSSDPVVIRPVARLMPSIVFP